MIYHSSCAELAAEVPAASVDFIITDPPYPKEFLPCWSELAEFAAHALKPGGSLLAMSGQFYLPQVFARLEMQPQLEYQWLLDYDLQAGGTCRVWTRHIGTGWKPVIWYKKSGADAIPVIQYDVVKSQFQDKRYHRWGQDERGMLALAQRFVRAGDTVVDPFVGGGSTAIAALALGCNFIGADIDADAVATTRYRMREYQPVMPGV